MTALSGVGTRSELQTLQAALAGCRACPRMVGTPVHGPPIRSRILLIGQAPGPREASLGRPFAWTAGKTLFQWLGSMLDADEDLLRRRIYISAVARCFPGKAPGGGDRRPDDAEIARCRRWLSAEVSVLRPQLLLPVGSMAIAEVLGEAVPLADVVGRQLRATFADITSDVIPLPHPSGASTWHRREPGKTLLRQALDLLAKHPAVRRAFPAAAPRRLEEPGSGRSQAEPG